MAPYYKAYAAAIVAGLLALGTALVDDHVTAAEWVGVAIALLGTGGVTYAVPNRSVPAQDERAPGGP